MKKLMRLIIIILGVLVANAQEKEPTYGFQKGDVFISGSVSFSSSDSQIQSISFNNTDDPQIEIVGSEVNVFQISPGAGYFISNHIALGIDVSYAEINNSPSDFRSYRAGVFVRYYYTPPPTAIFYF